MKASFLPKPLYGIGTRKYIIDRQTGKSYTTMHWHDCIEIVYVHKGDMKVFMNNKWQKLNAGDMVFVPPQKIHFMHCDNNKTVKTVIGISKCLICDENIDAQSILLPFQTEMINDYCFFQDNGELSSIFNRILSTEDTYLGSLLIQSELLRVYAYIYKDWLNKKISFPEPVTDHTVQTIVHILEKEFCQAPSACEMAERLNISYSHMARILSEKLGITYKDLLHSIRMENAKKMLLTTKKSITEIGGDCGFCDSSYFIKMFSRSVGTSPGKYRTYSQPDL